MNWRIIFKTQNQKEKKKKEICLILFPANFDSKNINTEKYSQNYIFVEIL